MIHAGPVIIMNVQYIFIYRDRYMTLTHACDTAWAQSAETETRDILTRDTGLTHVGANTFG